MAMARAALLLLTIAAPANAYDFSRGVGHASWVMEALKRNFDYGSEPYPINGSNDAATAQRWVKATNIYRCMHGVPYVGWSDDAAKAAQEWANELSKVGELIHFRESSGGPYTLKPPWGPAGENLGMGQASIEAVVNSWYQEVNQCDHLPGCEKTKVPQDPSVMVGHFTALIWRGVTQIGCAKGMNGTENMWVCRYLSGKKLGAWTANMLGGYNISVPDHAPGKTAQICQGEAPNALHPQGVTDPSKWPEYEAAEPASAFHAYPAGFAGNDGEWAKYFVESAFGILACCILLCIPLFGWLTYTMYGSQTHHDMPVDFADQKDKSKK